MNENPDLEDCIINEDYRCYEERYSDEFRIAENFNEDEEIDFERVIIKKKTLRLNEDFNKISIPQKRIAESSDEELRYSDDDDEIKNVSSCSQTKKRKIDCKSQSVADCKKSTNDLLAQLRSNVVDERRRTQRQRVFCRPVFGEESLHVTNTEGERAFMRLRPDVEESMATGWQKRSDLNLLSASFHVLKQQVDENRRLKMEEVLNEQTEESNRQADSDALLKTELWVEKYGPKRFTELLSDDGTNRILLKWLKLWDNIVFKTPVKQTNKKVENPPVKKMFNKFNIEDEVVMDGNGRPKHKIALLCGSPGLGKTTLAHIIAKHAGYNVVEMNASDDRSPEIFHNRIEASTQMKAYHAGKPNCLVIDEIDGAPVQAINILLDIVKETDNDSNKTKLKKKRRKRGKLILNRPIICICNNQYVPALRQLRKIALTLVFPSTLQSRLSNRLLIISQMEGLRVDMSALLLLCDRTENDIRASLNTLQFIQRRTNNITPDDVKSHDVGHKDVKKSVRGIVTDVFQLPRTNKRKIYEAKTNSSMRFHNILHLVTGNTEFEKITQGLFDHYLKVKYKETYMDSINNGCDWLGFTDLLEFRIQGKQEYSLMKYMPFLPVAFHMFFARVSPGKLEYSNLAYEHYLATSNNQQTLHALTNGMAAPIKRHFSADVSILELTPYLFSITSPTLRPVNTQLYSESEKRVFRGLVTRMIAYNLNFVQERNADGQYAYVLEPNIEEMVKFPGLPQHRHLPYSTKQIVAREVQVEKMRRGERLTQQDGESDASREETGKSSTSDVTIQHVPRKAISVVRSRPQMDFFGRPVVPKAPTKTKEVDETNKKPSLLHPVVRFRFNEGYTNAVRRTVKIHELM